LPNTAIITAEFDCFGEDAFDLYKALNNEKKGENALSLEVFAGLHHAFYTDSNIEDTDRFYKHLKD